MTIPQTPYPDLAEDRQILNQAVRAAGAAVLARFGKANHSWAKADSSPVSEADHEANDILHQHLVTDHPRQYGFLSEESADDTDRTSAKRTWIIDPIDGTRAFLGGRKEFTICAALIENGKALASAVFNPATDEFFEAEIGKGAMLNGQSIQANTTATSLEECAILGNLKTFQHPDWATPWPKMHIEQRNSTNYRLALIGAGQFDAMMALTRKADWDLAPGALIAMEAGAIVSDHLGGIFCYNNPAPYQRSVVCVTPALYRDLLSRLSHLPPHLAASQKEPDPMSETMSKQLLHLVFGGELQNLEEARFKNSDALDIVGIFPNLESAEKAWRRKAQATVDNAHMRYFIVHLHKFLDPDGDGKLG